jgi:glycosyltransferase involved in cell wall biosynthesis
VREPGTVHVVVPAAIDDPTRPSGGNVYDRRVCAELEALGRSVRMHPVAGAWPCPLPADVARLDRLLAAVPEGDPVLVDGLLASAVPEVVSRHATRLRLVVLVHMPLGAASANRRGPEGAMLRDVAAVVTTSAWTRAWLVEHEHLPKGEVYVAVPGTDPAGIAPGTESGGALLCVGAVTRMKGQDLLVEALASVDAGAWHCTCVGSLDVDPGFVRGLSEQIGYAGLADRLVLAGPLHGTDLDAAYRSADVLVLPSRAETYGMVVTEALAHGMPVIATAIGGVPEALGTAPGGAVPGTLVPAGDAPALAAALRGWLEQPDLRERARHAARARRSTLPTWRDAATRIAEALGG